MAEARRQRQMPGRQHPCTLAPFALRTKLFSAKAAFQVQFKPNRSDIKREKAWATPAVPSPPPLSPPAAFADPTSWPATWPVGSRCWSTWKHFYPKSSFQARQTSEPGPRQTARRQDLGDAAGCSIPYPLHYLIRVKDNANLEKTWMFLRVEKFWMWPKHVWVYSASSGFLLHKTTCLQTMPNSLFQIQLCQELMTSRSELRSCYDRALILLWEGLPGLKPLAWASLAEVTWEVATDPFGEQQTIASCPGTAQHPT